MGEIKNMGKEESFFKRIEKKGESILCDWLWRDSKPCIFSHPNTIVIPREYATTLVIIPAYIVSPKSVFLLYILLRPRHHREEEFSGVFFTFGYPMVLHR